MCRTYASLMIGLVVLGALCTGVLSGAAFIGPPEPTGVAPAILVAVTAGVVGFLWPSVSGWFAATPIEAVGAAALWLLRVAGVHAVVGGLILGVGVQWASRHREAA